ncbi:MAG: FG-GAP repeat-containing protein, partial [bacterium]
MNGDGFSDVIVGAPHFSNNGQTNEGWAYLYQGSATGLSPTANWTTQSNWVGAVFGTSVATAGDVNGDGFSDVIVGDNYFGNGEMFEGRAYVYYGNGGGGLPFLPRQVKTDDSAPIALLGTSDSESAFLLKADGYTAAGQGDLRLQVEVKPAGVLFDGTGLVTGQAASNMALGSAVSPLSVLASGLSPGSLYHWRLRIISDSPFFPRSRWLSPPGNAPSEADVRTAGMVSAVGDGIADLPPAVLLQAGAPNPFQFATNLSFTLPESGPHRLAVYDVTGREVAVLASGVGQAGSHQLRWDGRDGWGGALPNGMYFLRLEYGGQVE